MPTVSYYWHFFIIENIQIFRNPHQTFVKSIVLLHQLNKTIFYQENTFCIEQLPIINIERNYILCLCFFVKNKLLKFIWSSLSKSKNFFFNPIRPVVFIFIFFRWKCQTKFPLNRQFAYFNFSSTYPKIECTSICDTVFRLTNSCPGQKGELGDLPP